MNSRKGTFLFRFYTIIRIKYNNGFEFDAPTADVDNDNNDDEDYDADGNSSRRW